MLKTELVEGGLRLEADSAKTQFLVPPAPNKVPHGSSRIIKSSVHHRKGHPEKVEHMFLNNKSKLGHL